LQYNTEEEIALLHSRNIGLCLLVTSTGRPPIKPVGRKTQRRDKAFQKKLKQALTY